jgi:hypothetical protein
MSKPEPLTPPDSDLSDFGFMPFDVGRFRRSDLVTQEEPEAIVAAILLWGAAWHSKPAASLSNDDRTLAQAAGFGRAVAAFQAIKAGALRGFVECADGRLYHPVVAEKAREAWLAKLRRAWQVECARLRKWNERHPEDKKETPTFEQWVESRNASRGTGVIVARDNAPASQVTCAESHAGHDEREPVVARDGPPEPELEPDPLVGSVKEMLDADEQEGGSRVTTAIVCRDIALDSRGRAGKGQGEGQGEGEGDSRDYANASSPTGDDEFDEAGPADLIGRVALLGRIAGLNLTVPAKLVAATDTLKAWEAEGFDFATIAATVKSRTIESPSEPVYSLRYFDAAVRKAAALTLNGHAPRPPAKPRDPPKPIGMTDDADERVATFRRRLAYTLGEERYRLRFAPEHCAVRVVDDRLLEVYFRSSAEERLVTMGADEQTMSEIARRLGLTLRTRVAPTS